MNHPEKFRSMLKTSVIFEYFIYVVLGSVGYCAYGNTINSVIMSNVSDTISKIGNGIDIVYKVLNMMFSLSLMVTLAMKNIVGIEIFQNLIDRLVPKFKKFKYSQWVLIYAYIFFYIVIP